MEERFYQEGIVADLAYKRVTTYVNAHSTAVDAETLYYYGYDQVGNVVFVSKDTDMSTSREFVFHQDAFGNELNTGVFTGNTWTTAANRSTRITEHQTGKDLDPFTGLYYFSARWYDPMVGRFVGRASVRKDIEQEYLYCEANPLSSVDVSGEQRAYGTSPATIDGLIEDVKNCNGLDKGRKGFLNWLKSLLGWDSSPPHYMRNPGAGVAPFVPKPISPGTIPGWVDGPGGFRGPISEALDKVDEIRFQQSCRKSCPTQRQFSVVDEIISGRY